MDTSSTRPPSRTDLEGGSILAPAIQPAGQYLTLYILLWNETTATVHLCANEGVRGILSHRREFSAKPGQPTLPQGTWPRGAEPQTLGDANPCPAPPNLAPLTPRTGTSAASSLPAWSPASHLSQGQHLYRPTAPEFNGTLDFLACILPTTGEILWYTNIFFMQSLSKRSCKWLLQHV